MVLSIRENDWLIWPASVYYSTWIGHVASKEKGTFRVLWFDSLQTKNPTYSYYDYSELNHRVVHKVNQKISLETVEFLSMFDPYLEKYLKTGEV